MGINIVVKLINFVVLQAPVDHKQAIDVDNKKTLLETVMKSNSLWIHDLNKMKSNMNPRYQELKLD